MRPGVADIDITRGDTFNAFFRIKRKSDGVYVPLTGWSGIAQIRVAYDDVTPLASFTVTLANQVSYPGGVLVTMAKTVTATLNYAEPVASKQIGIWDCQMTNDIGEDNTFLAGKVTLWKDVSRP